MSYEKDEIIKTNRKFYDARNRYDIDLIEQVWLTDVRAKCVHAGWPIIFGWEAIKESWKTIFETGGFDRVDISDFFVEVKGNSAWLNCVERATYSLDDRRVVVRGPGNQHILSMRMENGRWRFTMPL